MFFSLHIFLKVWNTKPYKANHYVQKSSTQYFHCCIQADHVNSHFVKATEQNSVVTKACMKTVHLFNNEQKVGWGALLPPEIGSK